MGSQRTRSETTGLEGGFCSTALKVFALSSGSLWPTTAEAVRWEGQQTVGFNHISILLPKGGGGGGGGTQADWKTFLGGAAFHTKGQKSPREGTKFPRG